MNVYPYPIKRMVNKVPPYLALSQHDLDSTHALSLFKCMFKNAFQYTAVQDYTDEFIIKRSNKLEECFKKFVFYVCSRVAKANPTWTRKQWLEEVNEVVVSIMEEFTDNIKRIAVMFDGDEENAELYGPMYQTANTLQSLVQTYFNKHTKEWLHKRDTRRIKVGISSLRGRTLRSPMSHVFSDPYLSSHIGSFAMKKSLSPSEERELDQQMKTALPWL